MERAVFWSCLIVNAAGFLLMGVDKAAAWRGKRLACWLGAQVIQDMARRFGARGFSSGVKPDNPASQAMCARLGVGPSPFVYVGAADPAILGDGPVTR